MAGDRSFWSPERYEDEPLEVYHLRLRQQKLRAKSLRRGTVVRAVSDPLRTLQRQATKTVGARQARKEAKAARRNKEALKP